MDHRLVPAGVVDDAQAAVHEGNIDDGAVLTHGPVTEAPLPVGAAVLDRLIEDVEPGLGDHFQRRWWGAVFGVVDLDDAGDAAHYGVASSVAAGLGS
ncbi:MAG TPA: hypothetical protein DF699_01735, partial [Phycisphaerales bacterium]|nr:hypothetical protein [Phycisphaerales bacterium]